MAVGDCVERLRDVHRYGYGSAMGLALIETRDHTLAEMGEQGQGGGMPRFEAMLGGSSAQRLHDGQEDEPLQYLHCRAEQRDGAVGVALITRLPCLQDRDYDGVLPDCRDVNSCDREVGELCQEGQAMRTKMAEVKHGEPVRPLGGGGARLPDGRCDTPLVERPV